MKPIKYKWQLYHDGELIYECDKEIEVYKYLLNVSPFSTQWSIMHCGYKIECVIINEENDDREI